MADTMRERMPLQGSLPKTHLNDCHAFLSCVTIEQEEGTMKEQPFPRIRDADRATRKTHLHCEIDVTWADGASPQRFCGDNWCTGDCGLPALIIPRQSFDCAPDRFAKASGSQVACGSVMQERRVN
jgi:hypothetical protein